MIPSAFSGFMVFVVERTRTGALKWMSGEASSYITFHAGMSLYLSLDYDDDRGVGSFWFRLVSESGQSTPFSVFEHEGEYAFMRGLYEEVIANANDAATDVQKFMQGW